MSYTEWFETHATKHRKIVAKLLEHGYSDDEIIDYFDFDNMVRNEPDFCPLYAQQKKCHDMEQLNCYLCACHNFRFNDDPKTEETGEKCYSTCAIDSKDGARFKYGNAIHQDCSGCTVPHHRSYIRNHFDADWRTVMSQCPEHKD